MVKNKAYFACPLELLKIQYGVMQKSKNYIEKNTQRRNSMKFDKTSILINV